MKSIIDRTWVHTFVAFSFLVLSVTGILMLLHIKSSALVNLHQWIGVVFVAGAILHLSLNWSTLLSFLKHKQSVVAIVTVAIISLVLLFSGMFGSRDTSDFHGKEGYQRTHRR